jgi:dihydrolipoamide dehydrogenase
VSERYEVRVPDVGSADPIEVVEILVAVGDTVEADGGLVVMATDKASMDLPSPRAGTVAEIHVEIGGTVTEGDLVVTLESAGEAADAAGSKSDDGRPVEAAPEPAPVAETPKAAAPPVAAPAKGAPAQSPADQSPAVQRPTVQSSQPPGQRLVVIGSGPGGYTAAFRAADLGLDVTLIERYPDLGGVCLNVGCIPSKALLHAAKVIDEAAAFAQHGITFGEPKIDLDKLLAWKQKVVRKLTGGLSSMAGRRKVKVVHGTARFSGSHALTVADTGGETTVQFDQAIIAVGSRPTRLPFLPDDPRVLDSTAALEIAEIPERLLVIGGGIIGLEMATVYDALGSKVTVVELMKNLIPEADSDLVRPLKRRITERYEAIYLGAKVTAVKAEKKGLVASFEGEGVPESATFDRVLVAVGRRPNGGRIGAEAAGVAVDERGFIAVDRQQRTNVPHIFAIGDVVGNPMLAHKASHEAKVAAEVAAGQPSSFDARVIPSVAYTDPEVAWVGLTETRAKAEGIAYEKGAFPWSASGRSLAMGRDEGMTKLLFDPETHRLLGAGAVGPHAGDLISEAALAIEMDCEAADLALTVHPHPTLSETLAFSAEAFEGTLTDLYLPKKRR